MSEKINSGDIISKKDGFVIITQSLVLLSNTLGSYKIIKNIHSKSIMNLIKEIDGLNLVPHILNNNETVFSIGSVPRNKKSWILLASMLLGLGLDVNNQRISSIVSFRYDSKSSLQKIKKESKLISEKIASSDKETVLISPVLTTSKKLAASIIAVLIISSGVTYPETASAYYGIVAEQALKEGSFENASKFTQIELSLKENHEAQNRLEIIQFLSDHINTDQRELTIKELNDEADQSFDLKQYDVSLAFYTLALSKNEYDTRALNGIGNCLLHLDSLENIALFDKKELDYDDDDPFNNNGYSDTNDSLEIAKKHHQQVITIHENENDLFNGVAGALNGLGNIENHLGNYNSAKRYFDTVLNLYPLVSENYNLEYKIQYAKNSVVSAYLGKGSISLDLSNYEKAIKIFNKANDIDSNVKTLNALGDAHFRNGDLKLSLDSYLESLDKNENIDAHIGLAFIYYQQDNVQQGKFHLDKSKTINENILDDVSERANVLLKNKQKEIAESMIDAILTYDKTHISANIGKANVLYANEEFKKAFQQYEYVLELNLNSNHVQDLVTTAEEFNNFGQYDYANKLYELLDDRYSDNFIVMLSYAKSLIEQDDNDDDDAIFYLDRILELDPNNEDAKELRMMISK